MVPVYVGAALSFGLIFTSAGTVTNFTNLKSDYVDTTPDTMTIFGTTFKVTGNPVGPKFIGDKQAMGG